MKSAAWIDEVDSNWNVGRAIREREISRIPFAYFDIAGIRTLGKAGVIGNEYK